MSGRFGSHIRNNVVGYVALFVALSGTAVAVDGSLPGQDTVGSADIINGEVTQNDIKARRGRQRQDRRPVGQERRPRPRGVVLEHDRRRRRSGDRHQGRDAHRRRRQVPLAHRGRPRSRGGRPPRDPVRCSRWGGDRGWSCPGGGPRDERDSGGWRARNIRGLEQARHGFCRSAGAEGTIGGRWQRHRQHARRPRHPRREHHDRGHRQQVAHQRRHQGRSGRQRSDRRRIGRPSRYFGATAFRERLVTRQPRRSMREHHQLPALQELQHHQRHQSSNGPLLHQSE